LKQFLAIVLRKRHEPLFVFSSNIFTEVLILLEVVSFVLFQKMTYLNSRPSSPVRREVFIRSRRGDGSSRDWYFNCWNCVAKYL